MKSYRNKIKQEKRRKSALERNRAQLVSKKKPLESARLCLGEDGKPVMQDLSEADIKRIKKENAILESRITHVQTP